MFTTRYLVLQTATDEPLFVQVYVFSEYAVHKYSVEHEERNVWKVYLEKDDFPAALRYCSNDEAKLDQVQKNTFLFIPL
jgi:hypothetical protein